MNRYIIPMADHYCVLERGVVVGVIVRQGSLWDFYPTDRREAYHTAKQIHIAIDIALNPAVVPQPEPQA